MSFCNGGIRLSLPGLLIKLSISKNGQFDIMCFMMRCKVERPALLTTTPNNTVKLELNQVFRSNVLLI